MTRPVKERRWKVDFISGTQEMEFKSFYITILFNSNCADDYKTWKALWYLKLRGKISQRLTEKENTGKVSCMCGELLSGKPLKESQQKW